MMECGRSIDLNADLGEGGPYDAEMIALVSSANISCGGHAGDEATMRDAVSACLAHGVAIGAHPGYEDKEYFGRRELAMHPAEVARMLDRQLRKLIDLAGDHIRHVKLHGALYHQADRDAALAATVTGLLADLLPGALLYAPPAGALAQAADAAGLHVIIEGFADRRYVSTGRLVSRDEPDAIISHIPDAVRQVMEMVMMQRVHTVDGIRLPLHAGTICVHGDNASSLETLMAVRQALMHAGFAIQSPFLQNSRA